MLLQKILTIMTLPSALSYHFYNPLTRNILPYPSINNIPEGYRLLPAPKHNTRNGRGNRGSGSGTCTDAGFTCSSPYEKSQTFQFECDYDSQCPTFYKCCTQKCFLHKICSRASIEVPPNGNNGYERPGTCEKWPYNCRTPYHHSLTSMFKCYSDRKCPRGFKCCTQSCFSHRICSRTSGVNINGSVKPTQPIRGVASTRTPETLITYAIKQHIFEEDYGEPFEAITKSVPSTESPSTTVDLEAPQLTVDYETDKFEGVSNTESPITTDQEQTFENVSSTETPVSESDSETHVTLDIFTDEGPKEEGKKDEEGSVEVIDKEYNIRRLATTNSSRKKPVFGTTTPDSNAIVPEYAAYYYHYGEGNDTEDEYEDFEDEDEDLEDENE